jgi:hypothetical protein
MLWFIKGKRKIKEFFKFGRKPTMLTKGRGGAQQPETDPNSTVPEAAVGSHPSTSTIGTHLRYRKVAKFLIK